MTVEWWIKFGIWVAAVPQVTFVLWYGIGAPWWTSILGRAVFTKALALALVLVLTLVGLFWPQYPYQQECSLGVIWLIAAGSWQQLVALAVEQTRKRYTDDGRRADGFTDAHGRHR